MELSDIVKFGKRIILSKINLGECDDLLKLYIKALPFIDGLEELDCSSTSITSDTLNLTPYLKVLNCNHTEITTITGFNLVNLKCGYCENLSELKLSNPDKLTELHCAKTRIPIETLKLMTNLRILDCSYFSHVDFSRFANLEILDCDFVKFTEINLPIDNKLISLTCSFSTIVGKLFMLLQHLEFLDCYGCYNITDKNLSKLTKLKVLECKFVKLTGECFKDLLNLENLGCYNCEKLQFKNLRYLVNLKQLLIGPTEKLIPEHLISMKKLKRVYAPFCPNLIKMSGVEVIKPPFGECEELEENPCDQFR